MGLKKALKKAQQQVVKVAGKAGGQVAEAAQLVAGKTHTHIRHLNADIQTAVVKNLDLGPCRRLAREEIEKFKKNAAFIEAINNHGSFDKTILELETEIASAFKLYSTVESHAALNEQSAQLVKELAGAKACIAASAWTVSKLKETKTDILTSMATAEQHYKILQEAPEMIAEKDERVATGKKAAELAIAEAKKVLSLFSQVDLSETLKTTQALLKVTLPKRLELVTSILSKLHEEAANQVNAAQLVITPQFNAANTIAKSAGPVSAAARIDHARQ